MNSINTSRGGTHVTYVADQASRSESLNLEERVARAGGQCGTRETWEAEEWRRGRDSDNGAPQPFPSRSFGSEGPTREELLVDLRELPGADLSCYRVRLN